MRKEYKTKAVTLIIIGLDFLLLASFLAQSLIIGCLIAYGYIPISAKWANQQLQEMQLDGFHLQADSFRLKLWQKIELIGLKIYHGEINDPILKAVSTEVQFSFKKHESYQIDLTKLVVTNGTLIMPAIYAPDGKPTKVLEHATFHLSPTEHCIQINSFVAKHEDIYLRGSIEWPVRQKQPKEKASVKQLYQLIASALKEKEKISPFIQPTLEFALSTRLDNSIDVSLILSCEQLKHPRITGSYFSLSTDFALNEGNLNPQAPLLLRAREITFADLDIFAEDIAANITTEKWPGIFKGILPEFEVSTNRLTVNQVELNAPRIMVEPSAFPILQFSGTTCGLEGSAVFSGAFNSTDKSGQINANGRIDIFNLFPDSLVEKLPTLKFGSTPFYNLSVDFNQGFEIRDVNFHINVKDLTANELYFDNIITRGYYREGILNFEDIHIDRKNQWVDGAYYLDTQTKDFQISLLGSVLPKQYNSLLPKWWSNVFKDLHFNAKTPGRGDFVIHGNAQKGSKIALFGHVQATNLAYKEAFFDACELIVRGRQNYIEIHDINARVGEGRATGNLGFTTAIKPQKGLISVRYNFDATLPIEVASKSLGGDIANVLGNFELTELPHVQVDGVVFNKKFKEYADKDSVRLQAKVDAPLKFKGTPLDHLKFRLIGQSSDIYLRDVLFGYADGTANAIIDILSTEDVTKEMCFKLSLKEANQAKAIQNIPGSNKTESPLTSPQEENKDLARISGLVDLNLHAKGPLSEIYGFEGYGNMEVRNEALGAIQLLGPLSELLKNTLFRFTSFNLNRMDVVFEIDQKQLVITDLGINGPRTRISAEGTFQLPDQALDMDVKVSLFANVGSPDSAINAFGRAIASPLPNLLSFKLTGTVQDQKVRSKFDPRNLIP